MLELARRSLATIVPVFFALFAVGFAIEFYFPDGIWIGIVIAIAQFVICYFLAKGLAQHVGLIGEGETGPGFGSYFGVAFLVGLGTAIGFLLLVIPGIVLTVRWLLAFPAVFAGGNSPISKSWEMTGPVFWKLLAAYIIGMLLIGVTFLAYSYAYDADQTVHIAALAVANAAAAANSIYSFLLGFAGFVLLRDDSAALEEVFG
ncbi:hypothetical protein D6201_04220 [Aurantiacibacter aquimixticola]|uniref:Glycerophosphoryl diester phosphodiesterase membrane domain-containing protein n=2 Tax=Aurantiacibacter aquimixticola TaxID=1958945 RepID=A0A419RSB0_9SPHN|nr:hypothetical protein D6201_04220 [Aurantiacibacter aquimixticola]